MAKKAKGAAGEAAPPTTLATQQDITELQGFGSLIATFARDAAAFFSRGEFLIARADETLARAKQFTLPKDGAEDEAIQAELKRIQADGKEDDEHFNQLAGPISRFHRMVTGKRARAEESRKAAASHLNGLHNKHVENERRRVAQENEARRIKAEAEERARQVAQAQRLEAEALAREAEMPELSSREARFVELTLAGQEASRAAELAGYKEGFKSAARLLSLPKIQHAIKAAREAKDLREQAQAVAEAPVEVEYELAEADVRRAAGAKDRTTWRADITDADLLIAAVIAGKHGIPRDVLMVNPVKLNEYARSLRTLIDKWPGVRAVSDTKVV